VCVCVCVFAVEDVATACVACSAATILVLYDTSVRSTGASLDAIGAFISFFWIDVERYPHFFLGDS